MSVIAGKVVYKTTAKLAAKVSWCVLARNYNVLSVIASAVVYKTAAKLKTARYPGAYFIVSVFKLSRCDLARNCNDLLMTNAQEQWISKCF